MYKGELAERSAIEATGLEHRVYLPQSVEDAPVFLLLHGRTGTSSVMWPFTRSLAGLNPVILAPQAPLPDEIGGYSWWKVRTAEDVAKRASTLEELYAPVELILKFISAAAEFYGFNKGKIAVIGFSQGAGVASTSYVLYPRTFNACIMLAGFLPRLLVGEINTKKLDLSKQRFLVAHGRADTTIPVERARADVELLKQHGADVIYIEEDVGHKVGTQGLYGIKEFFKG